MCVNRSARILGEKAEKVWRRVGFFQPVDPPCKGGVVTPCHVLVMTISWS